MNNFVIIKSIGIEIETVPLLVNSTSFFHRFIKFDKNLKNV